MPNRIRKHVVRKTVLRLPDLDHAKTSVLNSLSSPHSRRNYKFAMEQFIDWYCSEPRIALNRTVVLRFRLHLESLGLAAGTINQRLAAVRRLAYEASDSGLLSPELAAGIRRVKGVKQLGCRAGIRCKSLNPRGSSRLRGKDRWCFVSRTTGLRKESPRSGRLLFRRDEEGERATRTWLALAHWDSIGFASNSR